MISALTQDAAGWVEAVRALGYWSMTLYAMVFLLATLAFLPASPLTAIAGYLYGPVWGTILISPVGVLSAVLAFGIGRSAARPWVQRHLARHPRLAAADRAVERGGFRVVLLLRLASIVPFAPLSYVLGASRIPARDFSLASWLGLLPGTFLYVYLGSLASDVSDILSGQAATGEGARMLTWLGLGAAVLAIVTLARTARAAFNQTIKSDSEHEHTV